MIHVLATIRLKKGTRARFLKEFHRLMPKVHREKGCIEYGPAVDAKTGIAAQVKLGPDTVVVVEKWRDVRALKAHLVAPHMTPYRAKVKPWVKGVALHILDRA